MTSMRALPAMLTLLLLASATPGCAALGSGPLRQGLDERASRERIARRGWTATYRETSAPLSTDQLGTPDARLARVLVGEDRAERAPYQLDPQVIADEATLLTRHGETCFEVTLNTQASYDLPVASMEPTCRIDGNRVAAKVREERASPQQLWYDKRVYLFWTVSDVFDITTRHATLCCPGSTRQDVELTLRNDAISYSAKRAWRLRWRWYVTPG